MCSIGLGLSMGLLICSSLIIGEQVSTSENEDSAAFQQVSTSVHVFQTYFPVYTTLGILNVLKE